MVMLLPSRWAEVPTTAGLLHARSIAVPDSGVAPELVLAVVRRGAAPPQGECSADVEDEDEFELGGHQVSYQRLAHRCLGTELLTERWAWQVPAGHLVLSATVAREDFLAYCEVFEEVAATVDPDRMP